MLKTFISIIVLTCLKVKSARLCTFCELCWEWCGGEQSPSEPLEEEHDAMAAPESFSWRRRCSLLISSQISWAIRSAQDIFLKHCSIWLIQNHGVKFLQCTSDTYDTNYSMYLLKFYYITTGEFAKEMYGFTCRLYTYLPPRYCVLVWAKYFKDKPAKT